MNIKRMLIYILGALTIFSCIPENNILPIQVAERAVVLPPAYYARVVYMDDRIIGFSFNPRTPPSERISFAYEGSTELTSFNPEKDPKCTKYNYFQVVSMLPDGRLGLLKECRDESGPTTFFSTHRSIYAYDWKTGELEKLVAGELTPGSNPKSYTWNPEMTVGIQETNCVWQGTIYWIDANGMKPMDIQFESRGFSMNMKDYLEGNEHTGIICSPAWSPDGKTIAFFVSTYGLREDPKPKYNLKFDLFLMDSTNLIPQLELLDVIDPAKVVWSPNNENLLFRGCVGNRLTCGLWIYNLENKTLSLVKEGGFADYIWVTNEKIVAAKNVDFSFKDNQVWEYTISGMSSDK